MSESDTMFNERDRRCAAVQLMLSTDPSYENRTIESTLKSVVLYSAFSKQGHAESLLEYITIDFLDKSAKVNHDSYCLIHTKASS